MGHPIMNVIESQWELRKEHDQNFQWGKAIVEQILASEQINKSRPVRITICDPNRRVNHLSKAV